MGYWKNRATTYNKLQWVHNENYLNKVVTAVKCRSTDKILDLGTGTGAVAEKLIEKAHLVIGCDLSREMLLNTTGGHGKVVGNALATPFQDNSFNKVFLRMVLHHITQAPLSALQECYRLLKTNGFLILSEGIPPDKSTLKVFEKIMLKKERRLVLTAIDLKRLLISAGFKIVKQAIYINRGMSVKNWLRHNNLPRRIQAELYKDHLTMKPEEKQAYNLRVVKGDCLIDTKFIILVGQKSRH